MRPPQNAGEDAALLRELAAHVGSFNEAPAERGGRPSAPALIPSHSAELQ